jgi:AcrR family transcriptional regulator
MHEARPGKESMMQALRERVLASAMAEAAESGWYDLRLHRVADRAGVSLEELRGTFRDADAIADAWFEDALSAMLAGPAPEDASPAARVAAVLLGWFQHQAAERRMVGNMLRAKLHLSHPHHWVPAVFNLSRLVHWALDAARVDGRGLTRQADEVGTTLAVLGALRVFPRDDEGLTRTRRALRRGLRFLDRLRR